MKPNKKLEVFYDDKKVGTLAITQDKKVAFEYDDEWIKIGFSISPFSLPLKKQVFVPSKNYFNGLFGVFADSLPDAWGNLLLERLLKQKGVDISTLTVLDKLSIVGENGMGALTYKPVNELVGQETTFDLDKLSLECEKVLNSEYSDNLDKLYKLGGSSGGARPKILTEIDNQNWIIKFPSHFDGDNPGVMEYDYAICAKECKIEMTDIKLFPSKICKGYFGTIRFDRKIIDGNVKRIHMISAAALLEADFRLPVLDYNDLMKLTKILTRDNQEDLEQLFRRMCFNIFAKNKDDHAKNFAYLYDTKENRWILSPAYDLTYSNTYYGEHTTSINGKGNNMSNDEDILSVGKKAGLSMTKCITILTEIREIIEKRLNKYL